MPFPGLVAGTGTGTLCALSSPYIYGVSLVDVLEGNLLLIGLCEVVLGVEAGEDAAAGDEGV